MESIRRPFQGIWNIIRFNWHFYVIALAVLVFIFLGITFLDALLQTFLIIAFISILLTITISLVVSYYVYDCSNLYKLDWLDQSKRYKCLVNINAGFDETSALLKQYLKVEDLIVLDFYDPKRHTEVSIKRARKAYPPYPNTQKITTNRIPLEDATADGICAILSAHEIRDAEERTSFFKELKRILKPSSEIIIAEHLRDRANFLAYNIGAFHFHSRASWLKNFEAAGLSIKEEQKITPFITTFILTHGDTH